MKSKIIASCMIAAVAMASVSCSDYLTEEPQGKLTPGNFFQSQSALDASVYALFQKANSAQVYTNMFFAAWQGDDMTANPGSNKQPVSDFDVFDVYDNNKGITDAWGRFYVTIKAANQIIENAQGCTNVSEEELYIALAQAHFWRAYSNFFLVRMFGPLPKVVTSELDERALPLTSVKGIYDLICEDLKFCENLPTNYSTSPRHHDGVNAYITKQAVLATEAAVYMARAGWPLNEGNAAYKTAGEKANAVINGNGNYGFIIQPQWIRTYSMKYNYSMQTVLGLDASPISDWSADSQFTSSNRFEGLGDGGWGDSWGEIKFWKYMPAGPRKDAIYAPKVTFETSDRVVYGATDWWAINADGTPVVAAYHPMFSIFSVNCDPLTGQQVMEDYDYMKPNYRGMTNGARHHLIRYSEVLLWAAECAARTGGDLNAAKNYLRQVRQTAVDDVENFTFPSESGNGAGTTVAIAAMSADQVAKAAVIEHGWEVSGYWLACVTRRADEMRLNELKKNFDYRALNPYIEVAPGFNVSETGLQGQSWTSGRKVNTAWKGEESIYAPYPALDKEKNPLLDRSLPMAD